MSSARARETRVKASVRIQREVKMRELAKEVSDKERIDERRPPPPAHRPSATQPILCHLKQKSSILMLKFILIVNINLFKFMFSSFPLFAKIKFLKKFMIKTEINIIFYNF